MRKKSWIIGIFTITLFVFGCTEAPRYEPNWKSLRQIQTPGWLQDGKFGIYTHWGPYAVHAFGSNTTWYCRNLYANPDGVEREHFEKTFGKLTPDFGYKDLIPMFTGEKFDADEWAELFQKAGARFAGPVAEHHDGFAMWDTRYSEWNAAKMGPKRDIVGELGKAIKKRDMKFVTAFHHALHWEWYPVWDKQYDAGNPEYAGLYGEYHEEGEMRSQRFNEGWYNKLIEVIENYDPDFMWFDFCIKRIPEGYIKDYLAYYYNYAEQKGKDVVVTYKGHDIVPGAGVRDLELGQQHELTYYEWITDTSIDDRGAWGWAEDLTFKSTNHLINNLIDNVSKNGYLLLNIGPKPDGTIPEEAKAILLEMGAWLGLNGEAIYGTTPWLLFGEGPTNVERLVRTMGFNEIHSAYTPEDIRFTVKDNVLYASFLDWPGDRAIIQSLQARGPHTDKIVIPDWAKELDVASLAGTEWAIDQLSASLSATGWEWAERSRNIEEAYHFVFREDGSFQITGGQFGSSGASGKYEQQGTRVFLTLNGHDFFGRYDGITFTRSKGNIPPWAAHQGFYEGEIKRITMLGDDEELEWVLTEQGLIIKTPERKGDLAHVFKIERHHHPTIK